MHNAIQHTGLPFMHPRTEKDMLLMMMNVRSYCWIVQKNYMI